MFNLDLQNHTILRKIAIFLSGDIIQHVYFTSLFSMKFIFDLNLDHKYYVHCKVGL